jgi:hypothetical protein
MTQVQLQKLVSDLVAQAVAGNGAVAPKEKRTKAEMLSDKDRALKSTFTKRGIKDVVLMDRNDPTKDFNVRPYKAWPAFGRQVRKGEKSVRGLFHVSQTDAVAAQ